MELESLGYCKGINFEIGMATPDNGLFLCPFAEIVLHLYRLCITYRITIQDAFFQKINLSEN